MKYFIIVILALLISCGTYFERSYNFVLEDCDDYQFLLHFMDQMFLAPEDIDELIDGYPLYVTNKMQEYVKTEIKSQGIDIPKIYQKDKSSIALTDQFCEEIGEKDGLHNPDYFNKVILLKFEIKQQNKFIYVKFIQKYPKMYCELKEFEITNEDRKLEHP